MAVARRLSYGSTQWLLGEGLCLTHALGRAWGATEWVRGTGHKHGVACTYAERLQAQGLPGSHAQPRLVVCGVRRGQDPLLLGLPTSVPHLGGRAHAAVFEL